MRTHSYLVSISDVMPSYSKSVTSVNVFQHFLKLKLAYQKIGKRTTVSLSQG